jgi:hypothetical protein
MPFHSKPKRLWDALRFAGLFIRTVGLKAGFEKLFRDARAFSLRTWAPQPYSYIVEWVRGHFV